MTDFLFCQEFGLDTLQKIFAEKGYCDNCREFTEKMIPLVMDDFKSREWIKSVMSINLIVLLLLVQVIHIGIRCYVKGWREERGYY